MVGNTLSIHERSASLHCHCYYYPYAHSTRFAFMRTVRALRSVFSTFRLITCDKRFPHFPKITFTQDGPLNPWSLFPNTNTIVQSSYFSFPISLEGKARTRYNLFVYKKQLAFDTNCFLSQSDVSADFGGQVVPGTLFSFNKLEMIGKLK